ncbi:11336_t:CDS:1, partial [Scutellospora calospora]
YQASRIYNNTDGLSRSRESKKEKQEFKQLIEKDKWQPELE